MNQKEIDELIENYLTDNLSSSERKGFEERMASDPELRAEVQFYQEASEAISEKDVIALEDELSVIIKGKKDAIPNLQIRRWMAIAASVLLVLGVGGWILYQSFDGQPTADTLYQSYLKLPNDLEESYSFRASNVPHKKDQLPFGRNFFESYRSGQYQMALDQLASLNQDDLAPKDRGTFYYYKGITHLQLDQPHAALSAFNQVNSGLYTENAEWYRVLCLLKTEGSTNNTKVALENLATKNHPRKTDAQRILSKLFTPDGSPF